MEKTRDTISFRLAPEFLKILNEQAAQEGKSPGEWARRLVIRALTDTERTEIREEVDKLQMEVRAIRGDFATLANVLLVKVAKQNPEEVAVWIKRHLASREGPE